MMPLDRRSFLRQAGGVLALAGASALGTGCSSSTSGSPAASTSTTSAESLSPAAWTALRGSLSGRLILPRDPSYPTAKLVYDLRFADTMPAGIAYCASPTDVQRCVNFARKFGVPITARSGGHSYGGYSTGDGLVVDVTAMSTVSVNTAGSSGPTATVGSGTLL